MLLPGPLGLILGIQFGDASGNSPNQAPSAVTHAWQSGFENGVIPFGTASGTHIATLTLVDPDSAGASSWELLDDAGGRILSIGSDGVVRLGTHGAAGSFEFEARGIDAGGASYDDAIGFEVLPEVVDPPDEPPPDGEIDDDDAFEVPPVVIDVDDGIKVKGKKGSGSSGKFIYDIGAPLADTIYTIRYDPDFTLLANLGVTAFVGFGFKQSNNFHLAGLKGDGSSGLKAYRIHGTNWNQTSGFSTVDGGAAAHGTQAGPNWLQIEIAADGSTYTLRTSADGETWVDEFTDIVPSPKTDSTDYPQFGIAVFLEAADAGNFSVAIELWRHTQNLINEFAGNGSTTPIFSGVAYPSALYEAATDTTWFAWEGWENLQRVATVIGYNHTTDQWTPVRAARTYTLADDDHGVPAIMVDADGCRHVFCGSHNTDLLYSSTSVSGATSGYTSRTSISGEYSYPKPCLVSGVAYLFLRKRISASTKMTLVLRASSSIASGVATFGSEVSLVDFGTDSRMYTGPALVVGSKIHFVACKADWGDTERLHVYYFVYDTATGNIENFDGSEIVAAASLPIALAAADADFRLFEHTSGQGDIPTLCFDTNGDAHVAFLDGTGTSFALKHIKLASGAWTAPVTVDTIDGPSGAGFIDEFALVPLTAAEVQLWYPRDADGDWTHGGDMTRKTRSAAGVWSGRIIIPAGSSYALARPTQVRNGHADARLAFSEIVQDVTVEAGDLKVYARGDSGMLQRPAFDPHFTSVRLLAAFNGVDGAASFPDDGPNGVTLSAVGNAQVDTAQSKFGGASALFDGTGDAITAADNAEFELGTTSFTIEGWFRFAATDTLQTLISKYDTTSNRRSWAFQYRGADATPILQLVGSSNGTSASVILSSSAFTPTVGQWYFIVVERASNTFRIYVDGVMLGSATNAFTFFDGASLVRIGNINTALDAGLNGHVDELRFTRTYRYGSDAGHTVPTAAFPRV